MNRDDKMDILKMFASFPKTIRLAICAGEALAEVKYEAALSGNTMDKHSQTIVSRIAEIMNSKSPE